MLPTCHELCVGFVPYAPLGRGFLTGAMTSTDGLAEDDFRRANPRFADGNLDANLSLVQAVQEMAREKVGGNGLQDVYGGVTSIADFDISRLSGEEIYCVLHSLTLENEVRARTA